MCRLFLTYLLETVFVVFVVNTLHLRQLKVDSVLCVTFDRGLASKLTSGAGVLKNLKIVISSPQSILKSPNYHHFLPML
jgi:hypothetical protein